MNLDQAYKILDYGTVPPTREKQIQLIQTIGYTKVNGVNSLSESPNYQIHKVAQNLFRNAEKKVHQYWKSIDEEMKKEQAKEHYENSLYDLFNISEEQRDLVTISELESKLLQ